jgi:Ser/Thr protein kinase RdoA (MazF antagonist)
VANLGELSDAEAFKEVCRINDDNLEIADLLCRARAKKAWISPESRAEFLAAARSHPEPFVHGCAVERLFREWVARYKEQAKAAAISMPLTDSERKYALDEIPYDERPQP